MSKEELECSFCGRKKPETNLLIAGLDAHICDQCIEQANGIVIQEAKSDLIETINSLSITINKDKLNDMFNDVDDDNFSEIIKICRRITYKLEPGESDDRNKLVNWKNKYMNILSEKYSSNLYSIN